MNDALWLKLGKTDPAHTKGFKRSGGFSGTALKPMWVWQRLTEEFGPCGKGWGMEQPTFQVVPGENREVLVYCTVSGWYLDGGVSCPVFGVGGDKAVTYIKANEQYNRPERWENDDEAFKKAFTDALMNAFKFIGVGADIHMGLFDDSKYVAEVRREFQGEAPAPVKNPTVNVHPEGPDWWGAEGYGMSAAAAKKEGLGEKLDAWLGHIPTIPTAEKWKEWCAEHATEIHRLPKGWRVMLREEAETRGVELGALQSTPNLKAA